MFRELTAAQSREFIDSTQAFEAWMATEVRSSQFAGGMHWKKIGETEYLYRTSGGRGRARSLGPRSTKTDAIYREFQEGKTALATRGKSQLIAVNERARYCKAARINRVPRIVTAVLRELEVAGLLGHGLSVVGTNALYAYEAAAACQFDTSLLATSDMDLLWDARSRLELVQIEPGRALGLMDLLRRADVSFEPLRKDSFRAANKDGYLIDLIKPAPHPPWHAEQTRIGGQDDLVAAELAELAWLQSSPRVTQIVIGDDGIPATMVVPDPRAFAVHKTWLCQQPHREPVKRDRDRLQAEAVASLVTGRLPNMPFEDEYLKAFPASVVAAARQQLRGRI
jgi:hypothetical protein